MGTMSSRPSTLVMLAIVRKSTVPTAWNRSVPVPPQIVAPKGVLPVPKTRKMSSSAPPSTVSGPPTKIRSRCELPVIVWAAALPSMVSRLPNGDGFQYAFANYLSYSGAVLEGEGIEPDIAIPVVRSDLLQGIDAPLQAAQAWIRGEQRGR